MAALAESLGVEVPQGRETMAQLKDAEAAGFAARDMAAMLVYMREMNS